MSGSTATLARMGSKKEKIHKSHDKIQMFDNIHKVTMYDKKSTTINEKSNLPTTLYGENNPFLMARNTIISMDSFVPA